MTDGFSGAKLMLFVGASLVVIERDDIPEIPWPGFLDWPGGGREGDETPETCVLRETLEEVGLSLSEHQLVWKRVHQRPGWHSWFFAAHLPASAERDIVFGDEGAGWALMTPEAYLDHGHAIPHFREQLRAYLSDRTAS